MMPISLMPIPAEQTPSTSLIVRPASSSAPRTLSPMIWNKLLSGAKRVGCSNTPATAVLRLRLIANFLLELGDEFFDRGVVLGRTFARNKMTGVRNYLHFRAANFARDKFRIGWRGALIVGARDHQC